MLDHKITDDPDHIDTWFKKITDIHFQSAMERGKDEKAASAFRSPRELSHETMTLIGISGRYTGYAPLVQSIFCLLGTQDQPKDLAPLDTKNGYETFYDGQPLSRARYMVSAHSVSLWPGGSWQWEHGLRPVSQLRPYIKKIRDRVLTFKLDKNDAKSFQEFYDILAENIWLIGNSTLYHRGSSKYVEQWLTYIHLKHGLLDTPILKKRVCLQGVDIDGPQLDCLDISYPLSLYKQDFLQFFEPGSLHEMARKNLPRFPSP
jgi:hypothetical protein